jgi:leucyl-tRNA synthetase
LYAINPLTGYEMPIWVSDFVLMGFGTGAVVGVPGHDMRDFQFANTFDLEIKRVVVGKDGDTSPIIRPEQVQEDEGVMINSDFLDGMDIHTATEKIMDYMEEKGYGKRETTYHLRDWLISRQRYWGPPIPMIHCDKCGWQTVPEKDLPVLLPDVKNWKPLGTGKSPLASVEKFVKTQCPTCGGNATRETDVSDTFLDSSWYFFRYTSTEKNDEAWDQKRAKKWLPVTMYIGGAEHSVLHLLYSRFLTMVFKDLGLCDFEEPFSRFYAHGLLVKDGAKMSKSKGNVVIPDVYIGKYGADTLRTYLMFAGPYDQGGDFRDTGIEGMHRFLRKVWVLVQEGGEKESSELERLMHKAIKEVSEDMDRLHYNTAIAHIMEYYNALAKHEGVGSKYKKTLVQLLAPFAPHMTEELWEVLGEQFSIHTSSYPTFDKGLLVEDTVTIVVQVNGKMRDSVSVARAKASRQTEVETVAKQSEKVSKFLAGQEIKKVIFIPGKIINFVVQTIGEK